MKTGHWVALGTFIAGLALLVIGLTTAGRVVLFVAVVIQLIYSAMTGKKTNEGAD